MTGTQKYIVELSIEERERLNGLISKGIAAAKAVLKTRILLKADQGNDGPGWLDGEIISALETNSSMVSRVRKQFVEEGLDVVLSRKKRQTPPVAPIFDGEAQARLIALACSEPPEGHARWTIRLLAKHVVEREIVPKGTILNFVLFCGISETRRPLYEYRPRPFGSTYGRAQAWRVVWQGWHSTRVDQGACRARFAHGT